MTDFKEANGIVGYSGKIKGKTGKIINGKGARTMLPTTGLRLRSSADYYKIVEATELVGSRRIVRTS